MLSAELKGKKKFTIGGEDIIVDERYELLDLIGCGAYGRVFSAKDMKTGKDVAIKRIQTAFDCVVDAKRILREIKILSKCALFPTKHLTTLCVY